MMSEMKTERKLEENSLLIPKNESKTEITKRILMFTFSMFLIIFFLVLLSLEILVFKKSLDS